MNRVILSGHLGRDPENRTSNGGTTIGNLRLATSERRKDRDGNWSDHTEWHTIVCFGRTAENVAKFCAKGSKVLVEGRLQTREWEKDGQKRFSTEVVADSVEFLDSRGDRQDRGGRQESVGYGNSGGGYGADDDIPF